MAKAKKQESVEPKAAAEPAAGSKKSKSPAAKAAPAAQPAAEAAPVKAAAAKTAKASKPAAKASKPAAAPLIQTSIAAEVAAKMVAQRASTPDNAATSTAASAPRPESSTFRNLKQGLAKPGLTGLGGILGATQNSKKSNQNYGGGSQVGRGQTFGSASKLNVPRRTGG